jgi:hypothetical protein
MSGITPETAWVEAQSASKANQSVKQLVELLHND